ncbi:RlpA-like double-psi beta-barrel domain-containing protein [Streptomyces sp. NBC_00638]|uniref:expansin EXLX1 family cellulose-binding protein n=1 Tax=unclassified Streptomyces TaxID=2593676 RepID=UPI00225658A0|nr:expansin EXLX1 family cellulose-binding protein [Streptomyces sp. NBC_00638]MCX5001389.1 RlpA-like double-psi beta-barrel domain-containing protein [Streptomyces sp. NBC_00638]
MKETRQAARRRRHRFRLLTVTPVALITAAALVCLVVAFRPGRQADAGHAADATAAGSRGTATSERAAPSRSASPTGTRTPTTTASPAATAGTAPARPSASATSRTAATGASQAGRIRPGVGYRGVATTYDAGTGDGACSFGPSDDVMTAAMNHTDYETSKACGAYVLVRAADGASVTVRITNECPLPCAPGQLDLSAQAFAELASPSAGRIPITWKLLSPSVSDTIAVRYKTGSSRWWCAIQVIGHRNPVARLELRTADGWRRLPRTDYNYFLAEDGAGCGGTIRITDIYGERLTVGGIAVRPDTVQPTRLQFARH